jgi:hypothetical protein
VSGTRRGGGLTVARGVSGRARTVSTVTRGVGGWARMALAAGQARGRARTTAGCAHGGSPAGERRQDLAADGRVGWGYDRSGDTQALCAKEGVG